MKLTNLILALLLICSTSCKTVHEYSLTYKLWNDDNLNNYSEPVPDPKLAIFQTPNHELLITYDEERENSSKIKRRAYYLKPNLELIAQNKKPHFINTNSIPLSPLPHTLTNRQFSVVRDVAEGPYRLPVYCERDGTVLKSVLTPFALVGDVVMVGVVAGFVGLCMMCMGGGTL